MSFIQNSIQLATLFNEHEIQWAYGGSSLLYFLDIPVMPRDLDIVVAKMDIDRAKKILSDAGAIFQMEKMSDHEFLTEKFYTLLWEGIEVDLMAVPGIRSDGVTFKIHFDEKGVWKWVEKEGVSVPLCDPKDWRTYYDMMHRTLRVSQLDTYLKDNEL